MHIISTNYAVADYCKLMLRKEITVNRAYQRSDKVWPPAARSFLIETILLDYPIPKLSLCQVTDVKSRQTYKEIVDGQQRSQAILDFYNDQLPLSKSSGIPDAAGKVYSRLDDDLKQSFLDYPLSVDLFVSATPDEIREVFRRINSYTVPLNPDETRHSMYQGAFKWFIYRLSRRYDQTFVNLGALGEKQIVRMADAKLFSEITHALMYGIATTNATKLNKMYSEFDPEFPAEAAIEKRIEHAMALITDLEEIHNTPLVKPYNLYALVLAISHISDPVPGLKLIWEPPSPYVYDRNIVVANLSTLAESLESADSSGALREFVLANISKTNVAEHRTKRWIWFCRALQPTLL